MTNVRLVPYRVSARLNALLPFGALLIALIGIGNTTLKLLMMAAVLVLQYKRTLRSFDLTAVLLLAFLVVYCVIGIYQNDYEIVAYQLILFPLFCYLLGKSFSSAAANAEVISRGLLLLGIAMCALPVYVAVGNITLDGFAGGERNLSAIQWDWTLSATVMAGLLTLGVSQSAGQVLQRVSMRTLPAAILYIALSAILVFVSLRLGSRTQLGIFAICIVIAAWIKTGVHFRARRRILIAFLAAIAAWAFVIAMPMFLDSDYGMYFRDRMIDDRYGVGSVGGRYDRWLNAVLNLTANPWGWSLDLFGYSHNLWLDVARVSGIVGLFFLTAFTVVSFLRATDKARDIKDLHLKASLVLALTANNLLFMLEPILDGYLYVFYAYCAVLGATLGVSSDNRARHMRNAFSVNSVVARQG